MASSEVSNARADEYGLAAGQRKRLDEFAATQCVDIHCHCLPCVDDGPGSLVEAVELCSALVADGITTVVATPHQLGRYQGRNSGNEVRKAVAALQRALMVEGLPLRVMPGADVRIDERIVQLLAGDNVLTLADTTYLLLELPNDTFIDALPLLTRLVDKGIRPIISHPERNRFLTSRPNLVAPWLDAGACLQLTSGSFLGEFGATAQRAAWFWLEGGQAALVASDAHSTSGRPPRMTQVIQLVTRRLGLAVARRVCVENPCRVIEDRELEMPSLRSDVLEDLTF